MKWALKSYQGFKAGQETFHWSNPVFDQLRKLPPIVDAVSILRLRSQLEEAERAERILLHTGDCAESFDDANHQSLAKKVEMFKRCLNLLQELSHKEPLVIGRIAGQYSKPRSSLFSQVQGQRVLNYRGDNVNDLANTQRRDPCTTRLLTGYTNSLMKCQYLREHMPELYISHEGLILPYEQALTRSIQGRHYCLSAHMLWIGERTRELQGAHLEFFRGVQNPIGVKISSKIQDQEFVQIVRTLNPNNLRGKLLVVTRIGHQQADLTIERLIQLKKRHGLQFLFVSDPMHGNTFESKVTGLKTRSVEHIQRQLGTVLRSTKAHQLACGISLQSTPDSVTECFGDPTIPSEQHLIPSSFLSKCDPRLTTSQVQHLLKVVLAKDQGKKVAWKGDPQILH